MGHDSIHRSFVFYSVFLFFIQFYSTSKMSRNVAEFLCTLYFARTRGNSQRVEDLGLCSCVPCYACGVCEAVLAPFVDCRSVPDLSDSEGRRVKRY